MRCAILEDMSWRHLLLMLLLIAVPHPAEAIVPPDLLFSLGSQFTQFISLIAITAVSIFTAIAVVFRQTLFVFRGHIWPVISALLGITLLATIGYSVWSIQQLDQEYRTDINDIIANASSTTAHHYYNDSITLWQTTTDAIPRAIMLDLNRKEVRSGMFEHFYYLSILGDRDLDDYTYQLAATSSTVADDFLRSYSRTPASDLSVRDTITGTIEIEGDPLRFVINEPEADFLTKHTDLYTRYHSATTATVSYRGETYTTFALAESAFSNDYRHYVYFPGLDRLHATTYQFILWDERGNFYLLDDTTVHTPNPAYPSHTWVLHKQADTGYSKKAFRASVVRDTPETWTVKLPDIASSSIRMTTRQEHYNRRIDRSHIQLEGTITDNTGTRSISGIGHLID